MSNGGLVKSLENLGISCRVCGVGDKAVYDCMTETGAVLGGERSGHIVYSKYETTGDGLVTAIMLMETLVENKCGFKHLLKGYVPYPQVSVSVPVVDKCAAMHRLDGVTEELENKLAVRLVVRPSGTERVIRVMAEGESEENCALAVKIISGKITT